MNPDGDGVTGIVLAGGSARRFGRDKLRVRLDGRTLLERAVEGLLPLCSELLIVTHPERPQPLRLRSTGRPIRVICDDAPDGGPLLAFDTALRHAKHPITVLVGGDMPFLSSAALRLVVEALEGHECAVPIVAARPQVLHAAYATSIAPVVRRLVEAGETRLASVLREVDTIEVDESLFRGVDPEGLSFLGVNTPAELATTRRIVRRATPLLP